MGEIVNLRRVRKRKLQGEHLAAAAEQRVRHGRTLAERTAERDQLAREQARFAGHRLEQFAPGSGPASLEDTPEVRP